MFAAKITALVHLINPQVSSFQSDFGGEGYLLEHQKHNFVPAALNLFQSARDSEQEARSRSEIKA